MSESKTPMGALIERIYALELEWNKMLTNPKLVFAAEAEWAIQTFTKNDYNAKLALAKPDDALNAVRNIAAIGVTLDPARKFAYILPRDGKMVFDLSYMGLLDIAISSGSIQWGQAFRVHEKDTFRLRGYSDEPLHERDPFAKDRGAVIGCYVVVKTMQGDFLTNTMTIEEVHDIRERSSSYKSWKADNKKNCPWISDAKKMELKTVVKDAYPYWPRSERLDQAIHYLNTDGGQGIELNGEAGDHKALREDWAKAVSDCASASKLSAIWTDGRDAFKKVEDVEGYNAFRAQVEARKQKLDGGEGAAPATNTPAPKPTPPTPAQAAEAAIHAAKNWEQLEATGRMIDALPAAEQGPLNDLYNEVNEALTKAGGQL